MTNNLEIAKINAAVDLLADLNIYEHYTDTAGFTDHVFALMHMLGFKFAPRIKDLNDKRFIYLQNVNFMII